MKLTKKIGLGLLALGLLTPVISAEKKKMASTGITTTAPQMDPAMQQAMKLGMPGEAHKVFEPFVGKWNCTVRGRMKKDEKYQESHGISNHTLIMGGRFLKEEFNGDWAGQPFEGTGTLGYDNMRNQYESTWMDNFSTGIMYGTGKYMPETKILKINGSFSCPMTGETNRWFRSEWKVIDNDNNTYTTYFLSPDNMEFQAMEIIYKRVK